LLIDLNLPKPDFEQTKDLWYRAENAVLSEISKVLNFDLKNIKKIVIYPSSFGTAGTFNIPTKFPVELKFFIRADKGIHTIAYCLVSSITRSKIMHDLDASWEEAQLLADWVVTASSLSTVLNKYEPNGGNFTPSIKSLRKKQSDVYGRLSEELYSKIGMPIKRFNFVVEDNAILVDGVQLKNLTYRETQILTLLVNKNGAVAGYDDIAALVFTSEEKFSLYSLSKIMQRLREKLEFNGISGAYIQTIRGGGFMLKS
jgi:hypothetical protein